MRIIVLRTACLVSNQIKKRKNPHNEEILRRPKDSSGARGIRAHGDINQPQLPNHE